MQGTYLLLRRSKKYRNPVLFRLLTERNLCYLLRARCRPSRRIYTRTIHDTMSVCSANNCENTGTNDHNQIILFACSAQGCFILLLKQPCFFKAVSTPEHAIWDKVSKRYMEASRELEAVLNLFRDRLRPMLKQIGVRDMQSIAGYWQKSRDSRCETGAQYGRNIPACNDNIISQ